MAFTGVGMGAGREVAPPLDRAPFAPLIRRLEAEQERWFYWVPVLFGTGIAAYFLLPTEPRLVTALALLALALVLRTVWREGTLAVVITGALLAAAWGFVMAKVRTEWVRAPVLERQIGPVEVKGFVELVEPRTGRGERITLRVSSIAGLDKSATPYRVRVRTMARLPGLKPGDAVRTKARLAPPAMPAIPGGYDFARAAYFLYIGGVGYSLQRAEPDATLGPPPAWLRVAAGIEAARQAIGARVTAGLAGETGHIANALITGERGGITERTNDAYRDSGLFHILSISGLHMVIMAGAVFWCLRLILAAIPPIALRYPIKKWAAVGAAVAALGYLLISGSAFATVRSYLMISVMFLAVLLDRPAVALRNVALAALMILIAYPESLFDIGFQMSFAAVVALVSAFEVIRDRYERGERPGRVLHVLLFFGGIILTTLIASLAVAPFAAFHFHKSQQYAIIGNLIAIPICNVVVMPAALAVLIAMPLGLEWLPLQIMGLGVDAMTWCARLVAAIPGAVGRMPAMPGYAFGAMVAGLLWLALWHTRWRLLGLGGIVAGIAAAPMLEHPDLIVGNDGALVAARRQDGTLSAMPARGSTFELQRWLEHDGDARAPKAVAAGEGYRCDAAGCTVKVKDKLVAIALHPSALVDDCASAQLLVLRWPKPQGCAAKGRVIDFFDLRYQGTHAVYIGAGGRIRVESVGSARGVRPWSMIHRRPPAPARAAELSDEAIARIKAFAAPPGFVQRTGRLRPEIEDEDQPQADSAEEP